MAKKSATSKDLDTQTVTDTTRPKVGRPSTYTVELGEQLCAQLAEGKSLRTVCKADGMPVISTVFAWIRLHEEFSKRYAQAKQESADAMAEEVLDIADDGSNDWLAIHNDAGVPIGYKVNGEAVQRSRLRVDTRKWLMAKQKPKKYGEKLDLTSDGKVLPTPIFGGANAVRAADVRANDSDQQDIRPS